MMRSSQDLARELSKILDTLIFADMHFSREAEMNAALHMSPMVRPTPLASAISYAKSDMERLIAELEE
jgi:hypothetical protein